jgi:hypothetical protein
MTRSAIKFKRLAGAAMAPLAGLAVGCGDSGSAGQPDSGGSLAPTHTNTFLAFEAHGVLGENESGVPLRWMRAGVEVRSTPLDHEPDLPPGDLGVGCQGDSFDLMAGDVPPPRGDLGTVDVTGWTGTGGGTEAVSIPSTISCTRSSGASVLDYEYDCPGIPRLIPEGAVGAVEPASFLSVGDVVVFNTSGGPAGPRPMRRETSEITPALTVESPELSGTGVIDMSSDLNIRIACPDDQRCRQVHMVDFFVSDNRDPFGPPTRYYADISCAFLAESDTIRVPAEALALLDRNPWEVMLIRVLRVGFPSGTIPGGAATVGKGEFFVNYKQ